MKWLVGSQFDEAYGINSNIYNKFGQFKIDKECHLVNV